MLVTVIIPCYNYAGFLEAAVKSVISQTYQEWECVIINDGSPDNTAEIAKSLQEQDVRVKYLYQQNAGLSAARNLGIATARGSYIAFLDADDLFHPEKLSEQVKCAQNHPDVDIIYGDHMFFRDNTVARLYQQKDGNKQAVNERPVGSGKHVIAQLLRGNFTVVSSPLIKRSVTDTIGGFDPSYRSYEDWHFWIRAALSGLSFKYCATPKPCTYIRFGHESMMSDKRKLTQASIQLRRFLANRIPVAMRPYNYLRLIRSQFKLIIADAYSRTNT